MSKYIVNNTNMAYKFQNGMTIGRHGVLELNDAQEAEMKKDYFYAGLRERGVLTISTEKPKDLSEAGKKMASKDAEIKALKEKIKELEASIDRAGGTGKKTAKIVDTAEPVQKAPDAVQEPDEEEAPAEQTSKGKKK